MRWREALQPVRMARVAILAPSFTFRDVLVQVADAGLVELNDERDERDGRSSGAVTSTATPDSRALNPDPPDPAQCHDRGRLDLLRGEEALQARADQAVVDGEVAGLTGWMESDLVTNLRQRVAPTGGTVVILPSPRGVDPPTQLRDAGMSRDFDPLVQTYATVPYDDVNPAALAGLAYVAMFGMMFADVGHGFLLLLIGLAVRSGWPTRLVRLRPVWLFLVGAGLSSMLFGLLYGELLGPTGVVPVIWMDPLQHPLPLLGASVAVGGVLLAGAYGLGAVNRYREGGWPRVLVASAGIAGATIFLAFGLVCLGLYVHSGVVLVSGSAVLVIGLAAAYSGLLNAAGGHAAGAAQAAVELFDVVTRLGSNVVSFARLAAFGLTHAALGLVIWQATSALSRGGPAGFLGAVVVFVVGNLIAFLLEGLVAAVQALRLEYYELFSRVFEAYGRPFRPWHIPLSPMEESR